MSEFNYVKLEVKFTDEAEERGYIPMWTYWHGDEHEMWDVFWKMSNQNRGFDNLKHGSVPKRKDWDAQIAALQEENGRLMRIIGHGEHTTSTKEWQAIVDKKSETIKKQRGEIQRLEQLEERLREQCKNLTSRNADLLNEIDQMKKGTQRLREERNKYAKVLEIVANTAHRSGAILYDGDMSDEC